MKRWVKRLVNSNKFFFESLQFTLIPQLWFFQTCYFILQFSQIGLSPFDILLSFHKQKLLLFIVLFDGFTQRVLSVFKHFNHKLEFFIQLTHCVFLLLLKLLFNFQHVIFKHFCFRQRNLDLLLKSILLLFHGIYLICLLDMVVADLMAFVFTHDTFWTYIQLAIFTKVLSFFLRMLKTKLIHETFTGIFTVIPSILLSGGCYSRSYIAMNWWTDSSKVICILLPINIIKERKVFY